MRENNQTISWTFTGNVHNGIHEAFTNDVIIVRGNKTEPEKSNWFDNIKIQTPPASYFDGLAKQEAFYREIADINNQAVRDIRANGFRFEPNPKPEEKMHPEEKVNTVAGNVGTLVGGAAGGTHKHLMQEAEKVRQTMVVKHDVKNALTQINLSLDEGRISGSLRDFYVNNPGALKEAVEEIQTHADILKHQHGDISGKAYAVGMLGKITGGIATVSDTIELGKRIGTAVDNGDWSPVVGQVTKMVGAVAAGAASMGVVRTGGLLLAGLAGGGGAAVLVGTAIAGGAISIGISYLADVVRDKISESKRFDFGKQLNGDKTQYDDLAVVGNFTSSETIKLSVKNDLTVVGNQHFKGVELEGKDISIVGSLTTDEEMLVRGDNTQFHNDEALTAMLGPKGEAAVEQQPADTQAAPAANADEIRSALGLPEGQYLNLEYLGEAAARAGKNPTEYAKYVYEMATELVQGQEFLDEYDDEWNVITGALSAPNHQAGLDTEQAYRASPQPANPLPDDYEMPSI